MYNQFQMFQLNIISFTKWSVKALLSWEDNFEINHAVFEPKMYLPSTEKFHSTGYSVNFCSFRFFIFARPNLC
jgi:hypothetical protein